MRVKANKKSKLSLWLNMDTDGIPNGTLTDNWPCKGDDPRTNPNSWWVDFAELVEHPGCMIGVLLRPDTSDGKPVSRRRDQMTQICDPNRLVYFHPETGRIYLEDHWLCEKTELELLDYVGEKRGGAQKQPCDLMGTFNSLSAVRYAKPNKEDDRVIS